MKHVATLVKIQRERDASHHLTIMDSFQKFYLDAFVFT